MLKLLLFVEVFGEKMVNGEEAIIAVIIVAIVILCIIGVWCCYIKRKQIKLKSPISSRKDPYNKVSEDNDNDIEIIQNDDDEQSMDNNNNNSDTNTNKTNSKKSGFELIGEEEGFMNDNDNADDKRYELQQWFNDNTDLSDDDIYKYCDMFIQNGYDVISSFRYIDRNELEMIGVHKRGHQRIILDAIKQYNGITND